MFNCWVNSSLWTWTALEQRFPNPLQYPNPGWCTYNTHTHIYKNIACIYNLTFINQFKGNVYSHVFIVWKKNPTPNHLFHLHIFHLEHPLVAARAPPGVHTPHFGNPCSGRCSMGCKVRCLYSQCIHLGHLLSDRIGADQHSLREQLTWGKTLFSSFPLSLLFLLTPPLTAFDSSVSDPDRDPPEPLYSAPSLPLPPSPLFCFHSLTLSVFFISHSLQRYPVGGCYLTNTTARADFSWLHALAATTASMCVSVFRHTNTPSVRHVHISVTGPTLHCSLHWNLWQEWKRSSFFFTNVYRCPRMYTCPLTPPTCKRTCARTGARRNTHTYLTVPNALFSAAGDL